MKVLEYVVRPTASSRSDVYNLYPLGDVHIGALNCAEKQFRKVVDQIKNDPRGFWFGGGDLLDAVILQDQKRFDPGSLPDWMLTGEAETIRERIKDIVAAQERRLVEILKPIAGKCVGLMEGNHEYAIMKYHNRNLMRSMCEALKVPELTDCCFVRFRFERGDKPQVQNLRMFAAHGCGGGRSEGAEPNHLARLAKDKECELVLRGHSHIQHIMSPVDRLTIGTNGELPMEPTTATLRAANWGCYVRTYAAGPSTYDSRATYPVRPLMTIRVAITPFREVHGHLKARVNIEEVEMR